MMTKEQIAFLESQGWSVICESPLEIEFVNPDYPQDGVTGFASGYAARELLSTLLAEMPQSTG